jgi:hypothetical protein
MDKYQNRKKSAAVVGTTLTPGASIDKNGSFEYTCLRLLILVFERSHNNP